MINFKNKFHGITSLALMDLATIIAIYTIATKSILWSALYTLYVFFAFGIIIYVYCRKCTSRNNCSHVFIGPITQLMPKAKNYSYTYTNYFIVATLILVMIGFPQFWFIKMPSLAYLYWVIILVASVQIRFFVCTTCSNTACAMCKKQKPRLLGATSTKPK